jgi:hypothetical protein
MEGLALTGGHRERGFGNAPPMAAVPGHSMVIAAVSRPDHCLGGVGSLTGTHPGTDQMQARWGPSDSSGVAIHSGCFGLALRPNPASPPRPTKSAHCPGCYSFWKQLIGLTDDGKSPISLVAALWGGTKYTPRSYCHRVGPRQHAFSLQCSHIGVLRAM